MELKTMHDIHAQQAREMQVYCNEYTYFLRDLEIYFFTLKDGKEKIREVLKEYDDESRAYIIHDLYLRGVTVD